MVELARVLQSPDLPSIPSIPLRLLDLRSDPETSVGMYTETVRPDPAICSKLITLANSAFTSTRYPVESIDRAVLILGPPVVLGVAFSTAFSELPFSNPLLKSHFTSYWTQSVVQAIAAQKIGQQVLNDRQTDFFLSGLLMDLGQLAMLTTLGDEYPTIRDLAESSHRELNEVEQEQFGFTHVKVGHTLMQQWKFPASLQKIVTSHHTPIESMPSEERTPNVIASSLAATIGDYFCTSHTTDAYIQLKKLSAEYLTLNEAALEELLSDIHQTLTELGPIFSIPDKSITTSNELLVKINKELAQIAIDEKLKRKTIEGQVRKSEQENEELSEKVFNDPLTGIFNRRYLKDYLEKEMLRCTQSSNFLGLLLIDIDHFKLTNDTYGYSFGDEVLQRLSQLIENEIQEGDIVTRYGGEEFIVVAHGISETSLMRLAKLIRVAIENETFLFHARRIPITVSIGCSLVIPENNESHLTVRLIAAADAAMCEAKKAGRNCIRLQSLLNYSQRVINQKTSKLKFSHWLLNKKVIDEQTLHNFILNLPQEKVSIKALAVQHSLLTEEQADTISEHQGESQDHFSNTAISLNHLTQEQVTELVALQAESPNELGFELTRQGYFSAQEIGQLLEEYRKDLQFIDF